MEWVLLFVAILIEVAASTVFKYANGIQNLGAFLGGMVLFVISLTIWSFSLTNLDVSVAYAVWAGVGTALIVVVGALLFDEPLNALKLLFIGMIIVGAIGLNLTGSPH